VSPSEFFFNFYLPDAAMLRSTKVSGGWWVVEVVGNHLLHVRACVPDGRQILFS